ncbi:MAG TPA: LytTR family DNA-binding domain-containing protein [Erysipelothrix sp.]|nr:LytTR family DNA-binding domain-containing protein [Erysipelothrix sp.]
MIKMKILCVDDEVLQHNLMKDMFLKSSFLVDDYYYQNGDAFFFNLEDHLDADAIFLDIEMLKMNGLEIAEEIRNRDISIPLVFITAHANYALQGYKVEAFDYILKPLELDNIENLLNKIHAKTKKSSEVTHVIDTHEGLVRFKENDLLYAETFDQKLRLIFNDNAIFVNSTLAKLSKILGENFIFSHRSFVVNLSKVKAFHQDDLIMENNDIIPVSRRQKKLVHEKIVALYKKDGYQL